MTLLTKAKALKEKFSLQSTQANADPAVTERVRIAQRMFAPEDLAEYGIENEPHVTIFYGLDGVTVQQVQSIAAKFQPFAITFGRTSLFENKEFDVVKVDVESPQLRELNAQLSNLPNRNDRAIYQPHLTLAYVKKGRGRKYLIDPLNGYVMRIYSISFSDRNGDAVRIPLGLDMDERQPAMKSFNPQCAICGGTAVRPLREATHGKLVSAKSSLSVCDSCGDRMSRITQRTLKHGSHDQSSHGGGRRGSGGGGAFAALREGRSTRTVPGFLGGDKGPIGSAISSVLGKGWTKKGGIVTGKNGTSHRIKIMNKRASKGPGDGHQSLTRRLNKKYGKSRAFNTWTTPEGYKIKLTNGKHEKSGKTGGLHQTFNLTVYEPTTTKDRVMRAKELLAQYRDEDGLLVFKDASGRYRWVTASSTAYRDRDKEIVSIKALRDDVARADRDGDYGTLRYWHVKGLDIGDCDFNWMRGKTLLESGTFRSEAVGQKVAEKASSYQISLGFRHPTDQPDESGVFHRIKRFERSLVPSGRVSNPFTSLAVSG